MKMPELGAAARGHHQRGRGRQAQRAGAGDDQHGQRGTECMTGRAPGQQPASVSAEQASTAGTNTAQIRSASRSMPGLAGLSLLHQLDQVRQLGVRAHLVGADHQASGQRDRAAGHGIPRRPRRPGPTPPSSCCGPPRTGRTGPRRRRRSAPPGGRRTAGPPAAARPGSAARSRPRPGR